MKKYPFGSPKEIRVFGGLYWGASLFGDTTISAVEPGQGRIHAPAATLGLALVPASPSVQRLRYQRSAFLEAELFFLVVTYWLHDLLSNPSRDAMGTRQQTTQEPM